jgi:TonB-linked SusC/RagA family outer membrane protein
MQVMHFKTTACPILNPCPIGERFDRKGAKLKKLLRVMKLTAIILLSAAMAANAKGFTQGVTLNERNASLEKVFSEINKQTGYEFLYTTKMLQKAKKINIVIKDATIQEVLAVCFKDQPFSYTVIDKTVVIKPKPENLTADLQSAVNTIETNLPPPIDISGKVTDADGNPLAGASVKVRGTTIGTTTNSNGEFKLIGVSENATLEISFVGYETYTVAVNNKTTVVASLKVNSSPLDQMQVIAYGTRSKRFQTSNVGTVNADEISKQPVTNPLLALQGRIPGLVVTQENGIPGGPVTIRIQGQNSIQYGNDPLIVIDGVPYPSSMARTGPDAVLGAGSLPSAPSPLNFINPKDIESISVLKDADATAIYGSRAANGAILITTKKGIVGKPQFDFNIQQGWGKVTNKVDVLNGRQYLDMRYEAYKNDGVAISTLTPGSSNYDLTLWDTTHFTDWQKLLIGGTAKYTNLSANISGGTSTIQYFLGATYQRQTTVFPGDFSDQRGAVHFNLGTNSQDRKFKMQFSSNYMIDDNKLPGSDLTQAAIQYEPVAPKIYNDDGSLNWAPTSSGSSSWNNPFVDILYHNYKSNTKNLVSDLVVSYSIIPGLDIKSNFGYTNMQTNDYRVFPLLANRPEDRTSTPPPREANFGTRELNSWLIEPQITFQRKINKGQLEILLGSTLQHNSSSAEWLRGSGYTSDLLMGVITAAPTIAKVSSNYAQYKYSAAFGRLNYLLEHKYILNFTARRDGSSRFGDENKYHSFGSLGIGWIFSEETAIKKIIPFLSFGKIRANYGTTGNDQIGDYGYLDLYGLPSTPVPYQGTSGLIPTGLYNPYLQWEETRKMQLGVDLGFSRDRILLSINYAINRSSNQLLPYSLPSITGWSNVISNFPATVQNKTLELSINTINIKSDKIKWTSSFNITFPDNKLIEFPNLSTSTYANTLFIGQPIGTINTYQYSGIDPATGNYQFLSKQKQVVAAPLFPDDYTVYLNTLPKYYGGFQNIVEYKGFGIDFLIQYTNQKGPAVIFNNGSSVPVGVFSKGSSNQPTTVLNRWQKPSDIADVQKYTSVSIGTARTLLARVKSSNAGYTDASFVRLKNISFSWNFPDKLLKKTGLRNTKIFFQAQNVLTITNYKGFDPENRSTISLPPLRMLTLGLETSF